jgi:hypothetical protein
MHLLGSTEDGIHRAGLDTQGAANAGLFVNDGNGLFGFFLTVFFTQRFGIPAEQFRQPVDPGLTAGGALVNVGFTPGNGFGVGAAAGIAAGTTLGLWQYRIDLIDDGSTFHLVTHGSEAEHQAEEQGQQTEYENCA